MIFFGTYTFVAAISVTFGYAFWFERMRASDYATELVETQVEDVTIALHEVQARFAPIATKLNSLAAYSEVTADLEIANGGTCGDRSGPQTGPRARQRQLDARLFRDAAVHVRGLSDRLDTAISALRAVEGDALGALQNQLRDSYQQVRVVRNDPELPTIFERLVRRRDLGRTGFPEGFTCPDGYLDTLIDEVVQAKVPDLPPPPTFFGGSRSDILNLVLSRQVAMFSSFFRGLTSLQPSTRNELVETRRDLILAGSPVFADSAVGKDMLPFAAAVVIDLLILIAGLLYQPMTGEDFNRNFAAMSEGTKLSPKSEKDKERLVEMEPETLAGHMNRLTFRVRRKTLVCVPLPHSREDAKLSRLLELYVTLGAATRKREYPSFYFPRWWRGEERRSVYQVYEFEPESWLQLILSLLPGTADGQPSVDQTSRP